LPAAKPLIIMLENNNKIMAKKKKQSIQIAFELFDFFWPEFREIDGLIFFKDEAPTSLEIYPKDWDKTYIESYQNHLHILDYFSHKANLLKEPFWDIKHPDFLLAFDLGKKWALSIAIHLKHLFSNRDFMVYCTMLDNPIIRFHQIHQGEPNWMEKPDCISTIADEEVYTVDTRTFSNNSLHRTAKIGRL
jgi:hypothetical protein